MAPSCLVTNDDGIDSAGLRRLARVAVSAGFDVVVAAPDREASGSSAAMVVGEAADRVVMSRRRLADLPDVPAYAVRAAPAFIAFTAVRGAFGPPPALVLCGINRGPNTGRAVLHSGTVGAAMTAALHGVRAVAFSLDCRGQAGACWDTAASVAEQVLADQADLQPGRVLNVNVPNVQYCELRGIRPGPLAADGAVQLRIVAATHAYIQVTLEESVPPPVDGTDAALVAAGFASVTTFSPLCEEPRPPER